MTDDPEEALRASWVGNAAAWTRAVRSGAIASRRLATDAAVRRRVAASGARRVLDLGCGEGWLARALHPDGVEVVGIDASAPLVEAARAAGGGTFQVLGYEALIAEPARLGRFDAIVANFALLERELGSLLRTLRGMLREDGRLIVQTLHPLAAGGEYRDGWREERFGAFGEGGWVAMPWYFRTMGSWVELLVEAGFVLERVEEPVHPGTGAVLSMLMVLTVTDE